jgi:hypothetical protein
MQYVATGNVAPGHAAAALLDKVPFDDLNDVREHAMADMVRALTRAGLYEKEARAMVDTWKDQWFAEEGTRVLYLLPRAWTDSTLPLQISPQPASVVRVMVGRAELFPPSVQRALHEQIMAFSKGDAAAKRAAVEKTRELSLGRFLPAAIYNAGWSSPTEGHAAEASALLLEVAKPSS